MPMNPRLLVPRANFDPDAAAYIRAVEAADTQALEAGVKRAIDNFVRGCKQDGIWTAIKASCILAGARTLAGALVPLKGAAPTNNGPFASGDYNRETGLAGNGSTKYLNTNRNNNADPQDDNHNAVYVTSLGAAGTKAYMGADGATALGTNVLLSVGFRSRTTSAVLRTTTTVGLVGMSRSGSAEINVRLNGASELAIASSSGGPENANLSVFRRNASGNESYADARLAFYSIGESLNLALLDTRVSALLRGLRPQAANADAQDWIDRVYDNGGTVSASTATAVNSFCDAIDAAGIRDRFYRLNLFCGNSDASLNAVRTPLYRGPSRTGTQYGNALDTNNNFVAGDYAETGASGGLIGNTTTKYLNTGLAPDALPSVTTGHLSFWTRGGSVGGVRRVLGTEVSVTAERFFMDRRPVANGGDLIHFGSLAAGNSTDDATAGLFSGSRVSATDLRLFKDGVQAGGTQTGSATMTAHDKPFFVFAGNGNGSPGNYYERRLAAYSIGDGMTAAQMLSYYNALNTFMVALSRT